MVDPRGATDRESQLIRMAYCVEDRSLIVPLSLANVAFFYEHMRSRKKIRGHVYEPNFAFGNSLVSN